MPFVPSQVEDLIRGGAEVNCTHWLTEAPAVSDAGCVELLLEKVAEVDALDCYNQTAHHLAAEKGAACVGVLLEYGANPSALDGN